MSLIDRWNNMAKKKIYINHGWEIPVGRLGYFIVLNLFISIGMILTGTTPQSLAWLWVDLAMSFRQKNHDEIGD